MARTQNFIQRAINQNKEIKLATSIFKKSEEKVAFIFQFSDVILGYNRAGEKN